MDTGSKNKPRDDIYFEIGWQIMKILLHFIPKKQEEADLTTTEIHIFNVNF